MQISLMVHYEPTEIRGTWASLLKATFRRAGNLALQNPEGVDIKIVRDGISCTYRIRDTFLWLKAGGNLSSPMTLKNTSKIPDTVTDVSVSFNLDSNTLNLWEGLSAERTIPTKRKDIKRVGMIEDGVIHSFFGGE